MTSAAATSGACALRSAIKNMKTTASIFLVMILATFCHAGNAVEFIDRLGKYPIKGSDESINVFEDNGQVRWSIRGATMTNPKILKDAKWFIATTANNDYWVYLGGGMLFHLYWNSSKEVRMDDCSDLNNVELGVPEDVRLRVKRSEAEQTTEAD